MNTYGSVTTTEGIKISVNPSYVGLRYLPTGEERFVFEYSITIENVGEKWVKLLSRRWLIIDADGSEEVVEGPGVVGENPELAPSDSFSYSSWSPLKTRWGTMEGAFFFVDADGARVEAAIDRFYLVVPDQEAEDEESTLQVQEKKQ